MQPGMNARQVVEVKSRPMLYSGPMVRAILAGRKFKTRRIAKLPLPASIHQPMSWDWSDRKNLYEPLGGHLEAGIKWGVKCPYGLVGDRLWVRETWQSLAAMNQVHRSDDQIVYRATDPDWSVMDGWQWKPSIFMPRAASRIALRIESIEVERLHAITDEEIVCEGFRCIGHIPNCIGEFEGRFSTLRGLFSGLWNKINGPGSWEANPFVWVIGFSRIVEGSS